MSDKERIYQALKSKNYFEYERKDSLEVLEKARRLEDVVIKLERISNGEHLLFRYNPHNRCFFDVTPTQQDEDSLSKNHSYSFHLERKKNNFLSKKSHI